MLFDLNIIEMVKETASEKIHVWLSSKDPATPCGTVMDSISIQDPLDAIKLHKVGHSLYCRAPAELESRVIPSFLQCLGLGIKGCQHDKFSRGEIETFYSRRGHITAYHTDFQENFTIVLSGKKLWSFHESTAQFPLRGCSPHFASSDQSENTNIQELQLKTLRLGNHTFFPDEYLQQSSGNSIRSVEVSAGDVLYHPAGVWHRVECLEDSISINISLISASYAELFCSSLQQLLSSYPQFRQPINTADPQKSNDILQQILNILPTVSQGLKPCDILPPSTQYGPQELEESRIETNSDNEGINEENGNGEDKSEGESESNEDEEPNEEIISLVTLEYPPDFLPHLRLAPSKKRRLDLPSISLRRNPLATLISSSDISRYNHTETSTLHDSSTMFFFICHSGYGNEHFESTNRVKVVVDEDGASKKEKRTLTFLKLITEKCLSLVNSHFPTISQQFPLMKSDLPISNSPLPLEDFLSLLDVPSLLTTLPPPLQKKKLSKNDTIDESLQVDLVKKVFYSFYLAGVLTFQDSSL